MPQAQKFDCLVADAFLQKHNPSTDVLKLLLTNVQPLVGNTVKGNITEIAATGGYTAGGYTVTITSSGQVAGVYKLVGSDLLATATGADIGPFQWAVLYNDTHASDPLMVFWDNGTPITIPNGQSFLLDMLTTGIFTIP